MKRSRLGKRIMSSIKPSVAEKFAEHIPYHRPLADISKENRGRDGQLADR